MARAIRDRFLDSVGESYEAMLSVLEASEARRHKVSRTVLAEARKGEREVMALARTWADSPASLIENLEAAVTVQTEAERRAIELARDALAGGDEYRRDVQHALARVVRSNRASAAALAEGVREARTGTFQRVAAARSRVASVASRARTVAEKPGPAAPGRRKSAARTRTTKA